MSRPELDARIDALNQLHGAKPKPKQKTDTKRTRVRSCRQNKAKRG